MQEKPEEQEYQENVIVGKRFVEQIWWALAKRIVRIAGEKYSWNEEQWNNANSVFLRPNDYFVTVKK